MAQWLKVLALSFTYTIDPEFKYHSAQHFNIFFLQNFFINVVSDGQFIQDKHRECPRISIRVSVVIRHKN